jgi:hypothetical protein
MECYPSPTLIALYAGYCFFYSYLEKHVLSFRGSSQVFGTALMLCSTLSFLGKYAFLIGYGLQHTAIKAALLFFSGWITLPPLTVIVLWIDAEEAYLPLLLSVTGFIAIPLLGYGLYAYGYR